MTSRPRPVGDRLADAFLVFPFVVFAVLFVLGAAVHWLQ
jgi:hypothetical protein